MRKELAYKMKTISLGLLSVQDDEGEKYFELGYLFQHMANFNILDDESAECLMEAVDRLNDSVVKVLQYIYDHSLGAEWYRCVIFLFDENVDFADCEDIIIKGISSGLTCEDFDEILKNSPGAGDFKKSLSDRFSATAKDGKDSDESSHSTHQIDMGVEFINHLKGENEKLLRQIESLERQIDEYQEKEKELITENFSFKSNYADKESEIEKLKAELSKAKISLMLSGKKYNQSQEMFDREKEINSRLSVQLSEVSVSGQSNDEIMAEMESLKADYAKIDDENVRITSENDALKEEIKTFRKENEQLKAERSRLLEEAASLKDEVDGLRNRDYDSPAPVMEGIPEFSDSDFELASSLMDEVQPLEQPVPDFSDFTSRIFNDDVKEDYSEDDVVPITSRKPSILKSCNIFARLLSGHFEKKFSKKPQAEQNNLIFVKLMEGNYSKDLLTLVRKTIEGGNTVPRLELYRLISSRSNENDIIRLCNAA